MAYIHAVKTASGARAVQIVHSSRKGSRDIEHIGSAHTDTELELLKTTARQRLLAGQQEPDPGLDPAPTQGGPPPITATRAGHLTDALTTAYTALGFDQASGGDKVFAHLVPARTIEPTSKIDSLRVLAETGIASVSYRTLKRRLPDYSTPTFREHLAAACARHTHLGPATLVLYDVTTLYFETDTGDGFRESGFSKERRLEPQITPGLLTDAAGFPLMVNAFEGNKAETTMLPTLKAFMAAHRLREVTVVADAGMVSDANMRAIEAEGLSFILGMRVPDIPYPVKERRQAHPGQEIPDRHVFTQPRPAGPADGRKDQVRYYRYSADRARRTLKGIDEQVRKAEQAVAGKAAVKRNRFVQLTGAAKSVNRALEARARALAGIKGYVTNIADPTPEFVIGAYHRLFEIEKSFRTAESDLAARPVYHHTRDSIGAHLTVVFAALAVSRRVEDATGWSIKEFVRTLRRYRTVQIEVGGHTVTAADPLPDEVRQVLEAIKARATAH